jgi:hypothetical protein
VGCLKHALRGLGRPIPPDADLLRYIGPPLRETFASLLGPASPEAIDDAVALYRERFAATGIFENVVYPDVPPALAELRALGPRHLVGARRHVDVLAATAEEDEQRGICDQRRGGDRRDEHRTRPVHGRAVEPASRAPGASAAQWPYRKPCLRHQRPGHGGRSEPRRGQLYRGGLADAHLPVGLRRLASPATHVGWRHALTLLDTGSAARPSS